MERRPPATDQARHSQALHLRQVQTSAFMCILNGLQLGLIFTLIPNSTHLNHDILIFGPASWFHYVPLTHHGPGATSISRLRFTSVLWLSSKRRAMSFTDFGTWQAVGPLKDPIWTSGYPGDTFGDCINALQRLATKWVET